jgi:hypothetical protein
MHEFESFETAKFVGRLLGRGDWGGFLDKVKDVIPEVRISPLPSFFPSVLHVFHPSGRSSLRASGSSTPACPPARLRRRTSSRS